MPLTLGAIADRCECTFEPSSAKGFSAVWCKRLEWDAFVDPQYCVLHCVSWPLPLAPSERELQAAEEFL